MRLPLALTSLALASCGGGGPSAESVVRAWSEAVNANDHEGAAALFARDARVVDDRTVRRLRTFDDAVRWNMALTCSRRVIELTARGERVRATFVLGHRRAARCDEAGTRAQELFRVRDGKIVLWHQLERGLQPDDESV